MAKRTDYSHSYLLAKACGLLFAYGHAHGLAMAGLAWLYKYMYYYDMHRAIGTSCQ